MSGNKACSIENLFRQILIHGSEIWFPFPNRGIEKANIMDGSVFLGKHEGYQKT